MRSGLTSSDHLLIIVHTHAVLFFSGVFVSKQKGDTDMGSKVPKDILVKGEST